MWRFALARSLFLAGVILLALGATWKYICPPESYWSAKQAEEYANAQVALKIAATSGVRPANDATDPEVAAAGARFEKSKAELEKAIAKRTYTAPFLAASGIVLIIAGFFAIRAAPEQLCASRQVS